jgi:2,5-diamino-6-(ribosylamino)-4(3H)-pyrimidinone 5'-phosphate reductase
MVGRMNVILHVAVSVDGFTTGFTPDIARFYALAATFGEECTLAGADTILAQEAALAGQTGPGPAADGPILAVVDGRGRVSSWAALRDAGHWSRAVGLHCATTPPRSDGHEELVAGSSRVDLAAALSELESRYGVRSVRVDSGGGLAGALLQDGLLDEVSLLVHPLFAGTAGDRVWYGPSPVRAGSLELMSSEALQDGLVWSRYRVLR